MTIQQPNSFRTGPDEHGRFGLYGGRFVAETLMPLILDLEQAYNAAKNDPYNACSLSTRSVAPANEALSSCSLTTTATSVFPGS